MSAAHFRRMISIEPKNWPLSSDERLNITLIESCGNDMDDLCANCTVALTDWHGNEAGHRWMDDLSAHDYEAVRAELAERLAGA